MRRPILAWHYNSIELPVTVQARNLALQPRRQPTAGVHERLPTTAPAFPTSLRSCWQAVSGGHAGGKRQNAQRLPLFQSQRCFVSASICADIVISLGCQGRRACRICRLEPDRWATQMFGTSELGAFPNGRQSSILHARWGIILPFWRPSNPGGRRPPRRAAAGGLRHGMPASSSTRCSSVGPLSACSITSASTRRRSYARLFCRLIDLIRAEPVSVAKRGRPVVLVMIVEEYERRRMPGRAVA